MKKLTKQEEKKYLEAEALVSLDRALEFEEREFVIEHWKAYGRNLVSHAGAFFTPMSIADELVLWGIDDSKEQTIVDLCAGTGNLSFAAVHHTNVGRHGEIQRLVCVELNEEYVRVGKKVLPEAEWYCADIFNKGFWTQFKEEHFTVVLSNPPFTRMAKKNLGSEYAWLNYTGLVDLMAAEVAMKLCHEGSFILPQEHVPFRYARKPPEEFHFTENDSNEYTRWKKVVDAEIDLLISSQYEMKSFDKASPLVELCDVRRTD